MKKSIPIISILFLSFWLMLSGCSLMPTDLTSREMTIHKLWVRSTLTKEQLQARRVNRMTPIRAGSLLIQANAIDNISAYDVETGDVVWRKYITNGVEAGAVYYHDRIYFGANDGQFYALEAATGHVVWTFPTRTETLAMPVINNGMIYFLGGNNILYALELESGKKQWIYARQDPQALSIRGGSSVAAIDDKLIIGFSDGAIAALQPKTGNLIWEKSLNHNKRFRDIDSPPVIDDGRVIASGYDDALYCLNISDGRELWRVQQGGYSSVMIHGDIIYYPTSDGELYALDRISGKKLWSFKVTNGIATRPVLYKGFLIFGESGGKLQFLDAISGKWRNSFEPGRGIFAAPLIDETKSRLYFISNEANFYALEMEWKSKNEYLPWQN